MLTPIQLRTIFQTDLVSKKAAYCDIRIQSTELRNPHMLLVTVGTFNGMTNREVTLSFSAMTPMLKTSDMLTLIHIPVTSISFYMNSMGITAKYSKT